MKRILLSIGFLVLLTPTLSSALEYLDGKLNEEVWYIDTVVILNGTKLQGPLPSKDKLCFTPETDSEDLRCFLSNHSNITKWTPTNITFVPPKNTPPRGKVIIIHPYYREECEYVYSRKKCTTVLSKTKYEVASFTAQPYIAAVVNGITGELAESLKPGKAYEIQGYRFGDSGRGLYLDNKMIDRTKIVRWTHDSIAFIAPEDALDAEFLQVNNGAGMGNKWMLHDDRVFETFKTKTRGTIIIKQPLLSSLTDQPLSQLEEEPLPFADISQDHPYYAAIAWGTHSNVLQGYPDNTFQPDRFVSRAEFIKIILEANGFQESTQPSDTALLSDIKSTTWFVPYITYAVTHNIAGGYEDGTFQPDQTVNLAEALKMSLRLFEIPTLDPEGTEWFSRYYEHALKNNVLFTNTLHPDAPLSRKDVVWIVWRLLEHKR